jgi:competence protein ComEC
LPFVSLVVMPAAVVGAVFYPLGLDAAAWWIMGLATQPVLSVSHHVAGFGGSVTVVPAFGVPALMLLAIALALATILTTRLRLVALLPFMIGVALAARPDRPDVLIDRDGSGAAIRMASGRLALVGRPGAFVIEQWLRADGDARRPDDAAVRAGPACDRQGCIATLASGRTVAFSRDPAAIAEDCERATLVITPLTWRGACKALMVDRTTLDRFGALAIHDRAEGLVAITSRDAERAKPWQPRARANAQPQMPPQTTETADHSPPLNAPQHGDDPRDEPPP